MAAKIRTEINILDHLLTAASGSSATSNEIALLDTTQFNGTVSYYFEIVADSTVSLEFTVTLVGATDGTLATITVPVLTTAYTLFRSTSFTPTTASQNCTVQIANTAGATKNVKSARIVIIQEATTLTNTETQIEIGNYNTGRTGEAAAALTNPKYWKYDAAKWDGTKTFYAEAVYDSGSMDTITVALEVSTDILAPSWSTAVTIVSAAETTVPTRTRAAFTPVDGSWYRITSFNGSMDNHDIYRAGVVVQQDAGKDQENTTGTGDYAVIGGTTGDSNKQAQSFTTSVSGSLTTVTLSVKKVASPTDDLTVEIRETSPTGTLLGTSETVAGAALTTSYVDTTFTFSTAVSLVAATKYYLVIQRSGARDVSNYFSLQGAASGNPYADGGKFSLDINVWSSESATVDLRFATFSIPCTKLEPQYLLANTLLTAGTSLQTFLTEWDSTEWDDGAGSIAYTFQGEAANGSTSDMTLQEADGGGAVTGSTLTNIDNAQISSALTMPADQNLDVIANANAGDVAAARILVAYTFAAAAESNPAWDNQDLIITS